MIETIKVGMADLNVTKYPNILTTLGLGSCVGVCVYDSKNKIIGMIHIMLPYSWGVKNNSNPAKFADTGIPLLIEKMESLGSQKKDMVAKLAGGAQMFEVTRSEFMNIGKRNVEAAKKILDELKIPIVAEDTGGNYGRTIIFYSEDGRLEIKTIGKGTKTI
ncbi:chemotaxis protein CheD [Caldicellulosiruptor changbaiensis]|uniref:Probable chemoreceptor glutamine deamidase CheD n=1 Tax=Caldicellulosiruptor changbaiensis TaxID=1222016 RepID=A0A3T0D441_9FIRM|nr:chemotaxis protein CheD [Caldicellulosiruptor changbaiensis]AZT89780.1 chemotaxis protein CheD [Caldicellulosiruptor changbaiensis]